MPWTGTLPECMLGGSDLDDLGADLDGWIRHDDAVCAVGVFWIAEHPAAKIALGAIRVCHFNRIELRRCIVRSRPQPRLPRVIVVMRQRRLERPIIGRSLVLLLRALAALEFDFGKCCADRTGTLDPSHPTKNKCG